MRIPQKTLGLLTSSKYNEILVQNNNFKTTSKITLSKFDPNFDDQNKYVNDRFYPIRQMQDG